MNKNMVRKKDKYRVQPTLNKQLCLSENSDKKCKEITKLQKEKQD